MFVEGVIHVKLFDDTLLEAKKFIAHEIICLKSGLSDALYGNSFPLKHQCIESRKAWINGGTNDNDNHDCQHIGRIERKGQNFCTAIIFTLQ